MRRAFPQACRCCCAPRSVLLLHIVRHANSSAAASPSPGAFTSAFSGPSHARGRKCRGPAPFTGAPANFSQGKIEFGWGPSSASAASATNENGNHEDADVGCFVPRVTRSESTNDRMRSIGMPRGYPHTVAPGYERFFYISVCTSFLSNFAMAIATQKLLVGFFNDSTPAIWMLKDLAPSLFAAFIANYVASYESRPKFWLVVSAIMTQSAVIADLYIPTLVAPKYFLLAAVVTSIIKQSAVLMYFVSRASVIQHFSINQNLGEITKKFNSIGMISYTVATAAGIVFTTFFTSLSVQTAMVLSCGATTIFTSYLATKHIAFRVLNRLSAQLIIRWFIRSGYVAVPHPRHIGTVLGMFGKLRYPPTLLRRQGRDTGARGLLRRLAHCGPLGRIGGAPDDLDRLQAAAAADEVTAAAPKGQLADALEGAEERVAAPESRADGSGVDAAAQQDILEHELVVNPAISALEITKADLDVAMARTAGVAPFTLGVWHVRTQPLSHFPSLSRLGQGVRRRLPQIFRNASLKKHAEAAPKLVLLVHKECELRQLLLALLIAHESLMAHGADFGAVDEFVCKALLNDIAEWTARADELMELLRDAGWETGSHLIDSVEHRIDFKS